MAPIAKAHRCSPGRISLAWRLAKPVVTSVVIGAKRLDQLQDNLAAIELTLTQDELMPCSSPEPAIFMGVFEVGAWATVRRQDLEPAIGLGRPRPVAAVGVDPIDAQPAAGKEFSA